MDPKAVAEAEARLQAYNEMKNALANYFKVMANPNIEFSKGCLISASVLTRSQVEDILAVEQSRFVTDNGGTKK